MSELVGRTLELLAESKGGFESAVKNIFNTRTMATLKISELSVGDWVYHDDIVIGREIAKIHRLNKDKNGETIGMKVYRSDGAFGVVGYIWTSPTSGDLHPIPITPEILEANGWEKVSGVVYKWSNEKHRVFVWLNGFSHHVDVEEIDTQFVTKSSRIEVSQLYVHQLQHALRLAGVDKEIVMP